MNRFSAYLFPLCILLLPLSGKAQERIDWERLSHVQYEYIQNADQNFWYGAPTFSKGIQVLAGKEVIIRGYVLPLDISGDTYVLSAFPFSTCFFCGGAGQESVMELRLDNPKNRFETDAYLTFVGTLILNDRELELNYILDHARVYKER